MKYCSKMVIMLCCVSLLITGCAGRSATPVMLNQPGDYNRSCSSLMSEMSEIESEINKRLPKENRTGQNVALGVAGAFLLVPWFFMNFSDAEKIEINAYRSRYNHLTRIYNDNDCGKRVQEIPDFLNKPKKAK